PAVVGFRGLRTGHARVVEDGDRDARAPSAGQARRRRRGDQHGGECMSLTMLVNASYLVAATLFLLGLQRMASPATARSGIQWAGLGMVLATVATFLLPGLHNLALILVALLLGTGMAWVSARKVAIT